MTVWRFMLNLEPITKASVFPHQSLGRHHGSCCSPEKQTASFYLLIKPNHCDQQAPPSLIYHVLLWVKPEDS